MAIETLFITVETRNKKSTHMHVCCECVKNLKKINPSGTLNILRVLLFLLRIMDLLLISFDFLIILRILIFLIGDHLDFLNRGFWMILNELCWFPPVLLCPRLLNDPERIMLISSSPVMPFDLLLWFFKASWILIIQEHPLLSLISKYTL
jgi:hypothetical protein